MRRAILSTSHTEFSMTFMTLRVFVHLSFKHFNIRYKRYYILLYTHQWYQSWYCLFIECDPMLRITTLWFSESISPLSETDYVVHNVFLYTQCMRYCDVSHIAPYTICTKNFLWVSKWSLQILLLSINISFWCI